MEPFCKYHIETIENPEGTDCSAHLHEARCFKCPYTAGDIQYGSVFSIKPVLYISKTSGNPLVRACQDFEPLEVIAEELIKRQAISSASV